MADNSVIAAFGRPFRLGTAGGAPPSMIGPVHRVAATMDGRFAIMAIPRRAAATLFDCKTGVPHIATIDLGT